MLTRCMNHETLILTIEFSNDWQRFSRLQCGRTNGIFIISFFSLSIKLYPVFFPPAIIIGLFIRSNKLITCCVWTLFFYQCQMHVNAVNENDTCYFTLLLSRHEMCISNKTADTLKTRRETNWKEVKSRESGKEWLYRDSILFFPFYCRILQCISKEIYRIRTYCINWVCNLFFGCSS